MKHHRLILGSILLLLLCPLMAYYSFDHNNHDPDIKYILDHFEQFKNTKVSLGGVVQHVDNTNQTLLIKLNNYPPKYLMRISTTVNISKTQPGDVIEVYGTLTSTTQITADKLLIFEHWKDTLIYLRSIPAIPFVIYLFFRSYRFNRSTYRFERRNQNA